MTAHLTAEQARALGIGNTLPVVPRPQRRALPGHGVSVCHACGEQFTTDAAETRHVAATFHARYDCDTQRLPSGHER